ncbi:hypothetical protein HNQ02_001541 [Flavobacterium sp. 7E]|uniref:hypothetical protein n=1 Tax=unclassified Flavobacterium TaxID=196869 RepID=UPI00156FA0EE|nr:MULTISPECIES: hypothetical protein [unclassified Flavobacterium]MBE0390703.1 hypothetical protein [Flavobacterium sp. PL002]NRS88623.1 hypothetical protein [Flavobacterium sp. 7E]
MKKDEVPQDKGNLSNINMKELVYATDEKGNYTTALSTGWEPKTIALSNSIEEISERIAIAKELVDKNEASPIYYLMEVNRMDIAILASYVGMWQWRVKRHFKPSNFNKLNDKILQKYAATFNVTVNELKNFKTQ